MPDPVAVVAGLGNPGPRYEATRHNAGVWFVERLARLHGTAFRMQARFHGELAELRVAGRRHWLLKPSTFMNRSGQSLGALVRFYGYGPEQILVVHDEIDLPPGTARLKRGGGHGGHNGLRDIMAQLGTRDFLRLRIGVGHPGEASEVIDYVLRRAPAEERSLIEGAIEAALKVFDRVLAGEAEHAMNVLHARGA